MRDCFRIDVVDVIFKPECVMFKGQTRNLYVKLDDVTSILEFHDLEEDFYTIIGIISLFNGDKYKIYVKDNVDQIRLHLRSIMDYEVDEEFDMVNLTEKDLN